MKKILFFFLPLTLFAFETAPWFTPIAEFEFYPSYSYRYYPSVNRGENPSSYSSNDQNIDMNLGVNFWPNWEFQFQTDFANTRALNWGGQRIGMQLRHLVLNDVIGDLFSLAVGGKVFYVPTRNLRDVSAPYHSQGNLELGASLGKEISSTYNWLYRFFGYLGVGTANRGYPWLRPTLSAEGKFKGSHILKGSVDGYFGFGRDSKVDISRFDGYRNIKHHSIDIGVKYSYLFKIWGCIGVSYAFRVYARSFPEHASTIQAEYRLPFSLF